MFSGFFLGAGLPALSLARRLSVLSGSASVAYFTTSDLPYTPFNAAIPSASDVSLLRPRFTHTPSNGMFTVSAIRSASRLPVRSRLTLIRLALIREPLVFRRGGFSPLYRYLYLHLLFPNLQRVSRHAFDDVGMLPLPTCLLDKSHSFGTGLMPDYYPRSPRSTKVSCYALFK